MINLRKIAEEEMEKTKKIILSFPWDNKKAYGSWLAQTYHMVCYSTRLVALAGAWADLTQTNLHHRFVDHAVEERGHQMLCISDLKALGHKVEDFPQVYQSAAMYQIQYFWIQHRSPIAFFGYTLALESMASAFGAQLTEMAEKAHGSKAVKFLRLHSQDDLEHIEEAHKHLDKLTETEKALVVENLVLTASIYRGMLKEVIETVVRQENKKAA